MDRIDLRKTALRAASAAHAGHDIRATSVLRTADAFLEWLTQGGEKPALDGFRKFYWPRNSPPPRGSVTHYRVSPSGRVEAHVNGSYRWSLNYSSEENLVRDGYKEDKYK